MQSRTNRPKTASGFTLIEVLIASVILFMFLAIASQAFNQSATASRKAERAAKIAGILPLLTENIRNKIIAAKQTNEQSDQGRLFDVNYQWRATLLERVGPPERLFVEIKDDLSDRYNLWQINVTISEGSYQRDWQYEEITWHR